jgi:crotonobetainyl-CoA:carnitine CoA-transferase CaiB-like acyl-CoA transferase
LNTNKSSVAVDLSTEGGAQILARLLDKADVVVDDHPDGWLQGVGLSPHSFQEMRPGLVLCSITHNGQNPPEDRRFAEDLTTFHSSGWGYHTPGGGHDDLPPLKGPGRFLVSYEAGMDAALCIAAALYEREETRKGRFIDISKNATMASRADYVLAPLAAGEINIGRGRDAYDLPGPAGVFPCQDGYIYLFMASPQEWAAFRQLLGNPDWAKAYPEDWIISAATVERITECRHYLCEWLESKGKNEAAAEAQRLGLPLVPINNSKDLIGSPQYKHRHYFAPVTHPILGEVLYPTTPYKLSVTPACIASPAPLLGQQTQERLAAIGTETIWNVGRDNDDGT